MDRRPFLVAAMALAIVPGIVRAQAADTTATRYALASTSEYDMGCFGPCECIVLTVSKVGGTFQLVPTGFDGLYQHYDVRQVNWTLGNGTHVTGSGTYVLGGEFALTQQMVLDLSVGGASPLRFDSGMRPGGGTFPEIHVRISRHQEQACYDTVFVVDAAPSPAGVPWEPPLSLSAQPDPFADRASLAFVTATPQPVAVRVLDAGGRTVRTLRPRETLAPGPHILEWDGRDDAGAAVAPGLYFVRVEAGARAAVRTLVRLR